MNTFARFGEHLSRAIVDPQPIWIKTTLSLLEAFCRHPYG
jgi:hypothetical protein